MTVDAADLALVHLSLEPSERDFVLCEPHDAAAFVAHVIEVQDADVPLAAVDATCDAQRGVGMQDVAPLGLRSPTEFTPLRVRSTPVRTASSATPVAVRAHHLALSELRGEARESHASEDETRDVISLLTDVVELADDRIVLAAVSTRMGQQVLGHMSAGLVDAIGLQCVAATAVVLDA